MIMAGYDGTVAYPTKCTEVSRPFLFVLFSSKIAWVSILLIALHGTDFLGVNLGYPILNS
jgi:hypothetical protein